MYTKSKIKLIFSYNNNTCMNRRNIVIIVVVCTTLLSFTASLSVAGYFYYKNSSQSQITTTDTPNPTFTVPESTTVTSIPESTISPTSTFGYFETKQFGGNGGTPYLLVCDNNSYIVQISGSSGTFIDSLSVGCSNGEISELIGGNGPNKFLKNLPRGIDSLEIKTGVVVDSINITASSNKTDNPFGGNGGTSTILDCGKNGLISGFKIRAGLFIDKISAVCRIRR